MPAEQGPVDPGWDAERFAEAIEQGRTPGSVADPGLARDLEIVAVLRSAGEAYAPRPAEKALARQRLMAMLAQPAAETTAPLGHLVPSAAGTAGDAPTTVIPAVTAVAPAADLPDAEEPDGELVPVGRAGRRVGRHTMPGRVSSRPAGRARGGARSAARGLRRRVLVAGAAALVAIVAVAGGGILTSRNALPGDALYAVKRVAESAGLAMTFDKSARAHRHLELAATRLDEVAQLVKKDPAVPTADPQLVQSAIQDFDTSTGDGSRSLMNTDDAGGAAALGDLRAWAGEQAARLSILRSALPSSAVPGADNSISLLDRLLGRTEALSDRSDCAQVTSGTVDDLGPLPATGICSPRPATPDATTGNGGTEGRADGTGPATTGPATTGPSTSAPSDVRGDSSTTPGIGDPGQGLVSVPGIPGTATGLPSSSPKGAPSGGNISVPVPLPLLPPISLPPLLPGQPGVTIG